MNTRKILTFVLVATLGGLAAIGIGKLLDKKSETAFTEAYMAKYASLSVESDRPDFVSVAELVTPTVVHILTTVEGTKNENAQLYDPYGFFKDFGF